MINIDSITTSCYDSIMSKIKHPKESFHLLGPSHRRSSTDQKTVDLFTRSFNSLGKVKIPSKPTKVEHPPNCSAALFQKVCGLVREQLDINPDAARVEDGERFIMAQIKTQVAKYLQRCSEAELKEFEEL